MSAPQGGYPPQEYPADGQYGQGQSQQSGGYPSVESPPLQGGPIAPASSSTHAGGHKKRAYASQAFEFGAGANSALGGQPKGGGSFPVTQNVGYGGYPQQPQVPQQFGHQQPGPVLDQGSTGLPGAPVPGYGDPGMTGVGGYQPPAAGYPPQGGVGGVTNQFSQLGVGGQSQPAPQLGMHKQQALNQLYPTDLITHPFNVSELDLPPPPIILPPNVNIPRISPEGSHVANHISRVSHRLLTQMLPANMCDQPSMLCRPLIRCSRNLVFLSL
jgi:protein transport protein SEC24